MDVEGILNRRPVGIKVNNYPRNNRPQWGLSFADIVWEYYHNNDLTRFHAIFYGKNAGKVGPVRSARPFDGYLVDIYKLNFVFASADYRVLEFLNSQDYAQRLIYILTGDCPPWPVCRWDPQGANFLLGDTSVVADYLQSKGVNNFQPNLDGMWFYEKTPSEGTELNRLYIRYSYGAYLYWQYDKETGRYLRYQDAQDDFGGRGEAYELLTDRINKEPIAADNVVVLFIPHFHRVYKPPADGQAEVEVVDMDFTGSGEGYAMRDGFIYKVRWVRPENGFVMYLVFPDGSRYPLKPGTTWYQVVTPETTLEKNGKQWRFTFDLPIVVKPWKGIK